jgi:hypothetical protein
MPKNRDEEILDSVLSMDLDDVRAALQEAGIPPASLLQAVRKQSGHIDRALDERTLDDVLAMDIQTVKAELAAAGVDPDELVKRFVAQLPELD